MGFSVSATMAIFFASFLILFSILYSSTNDAFDSVKDSFDERYDSMNERMQTQLTVLSASFSRESCELQVRIQNTGSIPLDITKVDVLLDGVLQADVTREIGTVETSIWLPYETLTVIISGPPIAFKAGVDPRGVSTNGVALSSPTNLSVGDRVYVLDGTSIDVFTLDGVFDFTITDTENLVSPSDLKVWGDYLYVLDEWSHIDRLSLDGTWVDRIVDDATNTSHPVSFAVDETYVYVIDDWDHVDRFDRETGAFVDQLIPNGGTMAGPRDISVGSYIFIVDYDGSYHIDRYDLDGTGAVEVVGSAMLASPTDISVSAPCLDDVFVYVVNGSREILVFDEDGAHVDSVGSLLSDSVMAVDVTGRMFVSDGANGLVIENLGVRVKVVVENGASCVMVL